MEEVVANGPCTVCGIDPSASSYTWCRNGHVFCWGCYQDFGEGGCPTCSAGTAPAPGWPVPPPAPVCSLPSGPCSLCGVNTNCVSHTWCRNLHVFCWVCYTGLDEDGCTECKKTMSRPDGTQPTFQPPCTSKFPLPPTPACGCSSLQQRGHLQQFQTTFVQGPQHPTTVAPSVSTDGAAMAMAPPLTTPPPTITTTAVVATTGAGEGHEALEHRTAAGVVTPPGLQTRLQDARQKVGATLLAELQAFLVASVQEAHTKLVRAREETLANELQTVDAAIAAMQTIRLATEVGELRLASLRSRRTAFVSRPFDHARATLVRNLGELVQLSPAVTDGVAVDGTAGAGAAADTVGKRWTAACASIQGVAEWLDHPQLPEPEDAETAGSAEAVAGVVKDTLCVVSAVSTLRMEPCTEEIMQALRRSLVSSWNEQVLIRDGCATRALTAPNCLEFAEHLSHSWLPLGRLTRLVYSSGTHGLFHDAFTSRVRGVPNTLTIVRAEDAGQTTVFGLFAPDAWDAGNDPRCKFNYDSDQKAVIFNAMGPFPLSPMTSARTECPGILAFSAHAEGLATFTSGYIHAGCPAWMFRFRPVAIDVFKWEPAFPAPEPGTPVPK